MPKKLKLGLNGLKVQSFVTSLHNEEKSGVKGGVSDPICSENNCDTTPYGTCETYQTCETDCGTCQGYTCDWWLCPTYQDPACSEIGC